MAHGQRTEAIESQGLCAVDVLSGTRCSARVAVLDDPERERFELAQLAVRRDNLSAVRRVPQVMGGSPALLFFGENSRGRAGIPQALGGRVYLGFPVSAGNSRATSPSKR